MSDRYDFVVTRYPFDLAQVLPRQLLTLVQRRNWTHVRQKHCRIHGYFHTRHLHFSSHDDITYESIAKAFGLKLVLHDEAYKRMVKLSKPRKSEPNFSWDVDSPAKTARLRMVQLPIDESRDLSKQAVFPQEELWVPVSIVNGNIHILPGVPRLCESPIRSDQAAIH